MDESQNRSRGGKIGNMSQELVVWVDQDDNELARLPRDVVHDKQGLLLHRETMELLFADPEHTKFWMQKRADNKSSILGSGRCL